MNVLLRHNFNDNPDRKADVASYARALVTAAALVSAVAAQNLTITQLTELPVTPTLPRSGKPTTAAFRGVLLGKNGLGVGGARIVLQLSLPAGSGKPVDSMTAFTNSSGWFTIPDVAPGTYSLTVSFEGYETLTREAVVFRAGDSLTLEGTLASRSPEAADVDLPRATTPHTDLPPLSTLESRTVIHRAEVEPSLANAEPPIGDDRLFTSAGTRWDYRYPSFRRYAEAGSFQYTRGHWYDPFNANRLKGDYAILGERKFLTFSAGSDTFTEQRQLPFAPLPVRAPQGLSLTQNAVMQNFIFSADLLSGDAAYQPADWRVRVTLVANLNYSSVGKPGLLNFTDPELTRFASQTSGLQEAFFERKLADLSDAYDTLSLRAGIQNFNSDFRGFIFSTSAPGVRLFGNLDSNRYQYNLAAFDMLVKDANSGLNDLTRRRQQVFVANLYRQDFLVPGYTIEVSAHFDKDDPSTAVNIDNFVVRPAPIGIDPAPHSIRALYLGFAGDGHIGPINVSHAFYQVFGHDSYNSIAGRPVRIDARMAAMEASIDRDWIRYRISAFYASGDRDPHGATATGFDSILNNTNFAGGTFSFWDREILTFSGRGVALTTGGGLLPDLRASLSSGQANFVNPGVLLANAGADFDFTPKLRLFTNLNLIRFADPQPLEALLGIARISANAGADVGIGVRYRPALNDHVIFTFGVSTLFPGAGLRQIYSGGPFPALFTGIQFRF